MVFFPIEENIENIITPIKNLYGGEMKKSMIGGEKADSVCLITGGEGTCYYFLKLKEKTLMITREFIDENVQLKYKTAEGFIAFSKQERLFNKIFSTFKFIK